MACSGKVLPQRGFQLLEPRDLVPPQSTMKISLHAALLLLLATAGFHPGHAAEAEAPLASVLAPPSNRDSATTIKAVAWPHEGSDLPHDASVTYGTLKNGLRYAIMPTKVQPGRASMRMQIAVGSLYEQANEQGLSHFLEHMAFNGMRRFPAGQTIETFQRMGMSFGAHNNAHTNFDETTYEMDLPRAGADESGVVLQYFRDVLDGMQLDAKEIDKERGVILREMSTRDTSVLRTLRAALEYTMPDTLYPHRFPIGTVECITKMPRERFVAYYQAWYRPERATIVVAGDVKVDEIASLIEREFADAAARGPVRAEPNLGKLSSGQGVTARWATLRDASSTTVTISNYRSVQKQTDTLAKQKAELIEVISHLMLNRRLTKITEAPGALFSEAASSREILASTFKEISVTAKCEPSKSAEVTASLEKEIRRAVEHGFSKAEYQEVKKLLLAAVTNLVSQSESRSPVNLAESILDSLHKNEVFMSPAQGLATVPEMFAGVDENVCSEAFRAQWKNNDIRILVCSDKPADDQIAAKLVDAYQASSQITVAAPADAAINNWAYTEFGAPGKIVERKTHEDLGLIQATFANNVRINIKHTDFKKNSANVGISFGGGLLEAPSDKPGLVLFTKANFINGGVKKHTLEDLNRAIAGTNTSVRFAIDEDAFLLGGTCAAKDLETQLQTCMAYLTEPAFRQESADNYQKSADGMFSQLEHSLEGMLQRHVQPFFRSGDCRWGTPDREVLRSRTIDEARAWLAKPLSSGYMEVTIVGDVDPEQVLELAAKTFGALPERDATKPEYKEARVVNFPKTPQIQNFSFTAETLRSMVVVAWPTADAQNFTRSCQLSVLSEILSDRIRLKIREELGAAYSPNVYNFESPALKDFGMIGADLIVDPKQATEIGKLVTTIAEDLRDGAISDDEFDRAIKPIMNNISQAARNNGYWMSVLGLCQSQPKLLDDARQLSEIYKKTTKEDIQALAKAYLSAERAAIVTLTPEKTGESVSSVPGKEAAR